MKKILTILLLAISLNANAQSFDDAISRFVSDSDFTVHIDSAGHEYVNISPYKINLKTVYTKIYFEQYNDFGNQPYQLLPARDSSGQHLPAIIGSTKSANAHFKLKGTGDDLSESIGFTDTNSNAYDGCHAFLSTKFLYWYFCDANGIVIED